MSVANLPDNKLLSLALQGYNPFQPEVGAFCGAYPGIMYPNPTTLAYPNFDPYLFLEQTASTYTPDGDYTGLGQGNPGIDYKNPGHVLGLLDTFGRMSYGIGVWQAIHAGSDVGLGIGPAVDITIPLSSFDGGSLGLADIYPAYTEAPSAWIDGFEVASNGLVTPDPRPFAVFPFPGGGHTPDTNPINEIALTTLFAEKSILSYIGMPQYFRSVVDSLVGQAGVLSSRSTIEFHLDNPSHFNKYAHQLSFFVAPGAFDGFEDLGQAIVECKIQNGLGALATLNGSTAYHDGPDGQNEYRSLTELNSVINIIPLSTVGATYWSKLEFPVFGGPVPLFNEFTGHDFRVASYVIADFVINVSDIPTDPDSPVNGTITIAGDGTISSIISDPTIFYRQEIYRDVPILTNDGTGVFIESPGPIYQIDHGSPQSVKKSIDVSMSMTNEFAWDKNWLGLEEVGDGDNSSDESSDSTETGGFVSDAPDDQPSPGILTIDQSDLSFAFNKTFALGGGCNSVRMRIFARNRQFIGTQNRLGPFFTYAVDSSEIVFVFVPLPVPHFELREVFHFPGGLLSFGFVGDPDSVMSTLVSPNINVSFSATGTNIQPINCEVSI